MVPAHVAARELERRRAERAAEIARQLPLYIDYPYDRAPAEEADEPRPVPDWTANY
ncbi:hypothetical protein [Azospirillum sp. ST 5-10]|uniref:hypothetical protein n=1 Tax=unclassified Azospirillum TaxID=2630922 RepID=UPI003F49CA27